jgi:hypothetical protein
VTAQEIRDRLAELREAGAKLRRRPARETHAALARVLELWASPDSSWRRRLEQELPGATGFTPENVREGLARGLALFRGEAWLSLLRAELGDPDRLDTAQASMLSGFDCTAVVLAGSIPQPTLLALLAPLALRSPVLAKPASRDPVTAGLVAASIAEVDPELGRCIAIARFGSDEGACLDALLEADCVAATGSDASIAALAARVRPPRRLIASGHRLSLAALGPEALRGEALGAAAEGVAIDVALWDQQGCLSPLAVYAVGEGHEAPDRLAEALAHALASLGRRLPRGAQGPAAAAAFRHECDGAELRAAAEAGVRLLGGPAQGYAVVREADATPRPAPLNRFLRVIPVEDPEALLSAVRPFAAHLAGVALAGFGASHDRVARGLADLGASRLCRPGELQAPPLAWRHEGRPVLLPFARFTDREAPR